MKKWMPRSYTSASFSIDQVLEATKENLLKYAIGSTQPLCGLSKCDCFNGYLRNKCGQCVLPSDCGKKCCIGKCSACSGPNEVRVKKFRKCHERSCKNLIYPKGVQMTGGTDSEKCVRL